MTQLATTLMGRLWLVLIPPLMTQCMATEIVVGDHHLLANTPGQEVGIQVTGGDPVSGIDLFVQIGDGGPQLADLGLPQGTRGPRITNVELVEQTIFQGVDDRPTDIGSAQLDQTAIYSLSLIGSRPSVPADGTLVRLTIDTSDLYQGTWDLSLSDVLPFAQLGGPYTTNFAGVPVPIQNGSLTVVVTIGDFDQNQVLDVFDLDLLSEAIQTGSQDSRFDVHQDGAVTTADHAFWVKQIARTHLGDSNLDGEFNSSDLVAVFVAGEYEDGVALNSRWATGDWNADGDFESGDLVTAFQDGGYEQGPMAARAVPEPSSGLLFAMGMLAVFNLRRRELPVAA